MHRVYQLGNPIPDSLDPGIETLLNDVNAQLEQVAAHTEADLMRICSDAVGLIPMGAEPITEHVMRSLPNLRVVARGGVGVDTVDIAAATELGIQVTNAPDTNYQDVAVHTLAMIVHLLRRIGEFDDRVRRGQWTHPRYDSILQRPHAMQLGIIGFGRSGQELARLASTVGFRIATHVRPGREDAAAAAGATPLSLDELLSTSDIVSLHIGLDQHTKEIIDTSALARFKKGAVLVNVSRGGLIDETALIAALNAGHLSGAALDVFAHEPLPTDDPLLAAPNTVLTPHIAYLSAQSLLDATATTVSDVVRVLQDRTPKYPVNTPNSN